MTRDNAQARIRDLQELLASAPGSSQEFLRAVAAGEELARGAGEEALPGELWASYQEYLARWAGELAPGPEAALDGALAALKEHADLPHRRRVHLDGAPLLRRLDEALSLAVALARAGGLARCELDRLGQRARREVRRLAPSLSDLWDAAWQRERALGLGEGHAEVFEWIEDLAGMSHERLLLQAALAQPAAEERAAFKARMFQRLGLPAPSPEAGAEAEAEPSGLRGVQELARQVFEAVLRLVQAPLAPSALVLQADGGAAIDDDDLAADGEVVLDRDGVEVRIKEVSDEPRTDPGTGERSTASLLCIRVRLDPAMHGTALRPADLTRVTDATGAPLTPVGQFQWLQIWAGRFGGIPPFTLEMTTLGITVRIQVE